MIVPIVMQFYNADHNNELTSSYVNFKRVYHTLIEHGVLVLPKDMTLSNSDFQKIYDTMDDNNKCKKYLRSILESVQNYQFASWDENVEPIPQVFSPTVIGLSESAKQSFTETENLFIEASLWCEIDQANLVEKNQSRRQKNIIKLNTSLDELWKDYFAPPLHYLTIKKIEIIDRYSLQNAITVPTSASKNHLIDLLTRINDINTVKQQKVSITLYSSLIKNQQFPEKSVTIEKIETFRTYLKPILETLPAIQKLKIVACPDNVFMIYNHDRYMIYSTGQDELSYVYLIGKGIEIFGNDRITAQTDISVRVRTRDRIDEYHTLLNKLIIKRKYILEWTPDNESI